MRIFFVTILVALLAVLEISAQAIDSGGVAWGRDYTFERMTARRVVHDKEDNGTIRLVAYVYRPLKNDRHEVVLFSHGSTGGLGRSPKEDLDAPPVPVVNFFISRGYTLVAPMRDGATPSHHDMLEANMSSDYVPTHSYSLSLGRQRSHDRRRILKTGIRNHKSRGRGAARGRVEVY